MKYLLLLIFCASLLSAMDTCEGILPCETSTGVAYATCSLEIPPQGRCEIYYMSFRIQCSTFNASNQNVADDVDYCPGQELGWGVICDPSDPLWWVSCDPFPAF